MLTVNWHQNPLLSTITLSEEGVRFFEMSQKADWLEDRMIEMKLIIEGGKTDIDQIRRLTETPDDIDAHLKEDAARRISILAEEGHCGDCTCVSMSCIRCHAEEILGFSTIEGLGRHEAYHISAAFSGDVDINVALARLEAYDPAREGPWLTISLVEFEAQIARWKAQAQSAFTWLSAYRDAHFEKVPA